MKPSAIFLCIIFLLAAVSCGKEKDNSHVPAGRVAHMTVTQHTPDRRRGNARTLDLHLFGRQAGTADPHDGGMFGRMHIPLRGFAPRRHQLPPPSASATAAKPPTAGNTTTNTASHGETATWRKRASAKTGRRCDARHSAMATCPTPCVCLSAWSCPPAGA